MNISQILTKLKSLVYSKSEADTLLSSKASSSHKHTKSEITDFPTIPTKTSQLTNDSGFLTSSGSCNYANYSGYVQGNNNSANAANALLRSGSDRGDSSPEGDTWIFLDELGGSGAPWGFKHNQEANTIGFYGAGTETSSINLSNGYFSGTVDWSHVVNRPTNVSNFTNDSGYITSSGSCNYANSAGYASSAGSAGEVNTSVAAGSTKNLVYASMADNDQCRIMCGGASNAGYMEIATSDDGNEPIYVRQYNNGTFGAIVRTLTLLDGSGNTQFPGTVSAPTFSGNLNGNCSGTAGSVAWDNVSGKPSAFTPYFANGTWYSVGDDAAIGDHNVGGGLGVKALNSTTTRIDLCYKDDASNYKSITYDGTTLYMNGNCDYATNSGYTNWLRTSSHSDHLLHTEWDGSYFWTYVTAGDGGYRAVRVERSNSSGYADSAGGVAWDNVSGRPWALSQFTNDSGYITADGAAYPRRVGGVTMNFNWNGQGGQPTWLWGGEDGTNMYVYNPANFSVNYANNAGYANSSGYADSAGGVAWGNVSGRPWAVSQFTNDSGFITSAVDMLEMRGNPPYIDFHASNSTQDYTSRIVDDGTPSTGSLRLVTHFDSVHYQVELYKNYFEPVGDTDINLGDSTNRWKNIFCVTDSISTSDLRLKNTITDIDDSLLDAWGNIEPKQYKFNDATEEKGNKARYHTGYLAQDIQAECEKQGVNASDYGLFCYDEWDEQEEISEEIEKEKDGKIVKEKRIIQPKREKGDRYSLRYAEALVVECKYLRRENSRLKENLASIEERLEKLEKAENS